ncbi:citrate synthase/methylcitrate synthase [Roseibium sp. RKSG952]|uniref:citrate synthase/methylcitrate synthase n=1 Tax=Roseibium sp. RKSG952 TaxID=2529384 RepID=UPI0012BC20CC|nr:citrate synthase/methylcitrate synthase [Roseibium sp. RKSG952]MTH98849.1 citrate synthase/methylcitrate synthase [Roseibium sp. RKSG952]
MTQRPRPQAISVDPGASLEGVVAAHTKLSHVDGQNGTLILRGKRLDQLAGHLCFEDAVAHLWQGTLPVPATGLRDAFAQARMQAAGVVDIMRSSAPLLSTFELMRLGLAALPLKDAASPAVSITGALPVLMAGAHRLKTGLDPVLPQPERSAASDLLHMLTGQDNSKPAIDALDRYLVTILDHGLNASTFAARVIASTQADMRDAVLGAMGALKGPLHGGAPGPVLDMIDEVGTPAMARRWVNAALTRGERLMGFGHRIYRTRDPRADVLKAGLQTLPASPRLALAETVEREAISALKARKPERAIETNVEFYTAVLLDAAGIDRTLFTPLFATGRCPGWCAHVAEQQQTGKLIRPSSIYVGDRQPPFHA